MNGATLPLSTCVPSSGPVFCRISSGMYFILHKAGDAVMSLQSTVFPSAQTILRLLFLITALSSFDFSTVSDDNFRIPFFSEGFLGGGRSTERLLGFLSSLGLGLFQIS